MFNKLDRCKKFVQVNLKIISEILINQNNYKIIKFINIFLFKNNNTHFLIEKVFRFEI